MALAILAFVAGALTVLAPCVLPLLPIIVGGSVGADENRNRFYPYIIATSLAMSLLFFTILLKASTAVVGVSPKVWTTVSGVIVIALGIVSLFPQLWEQFMFRTGIQAKTQTLLDKSARSSNSTLRPVLTGAALGPVFSSCSPTYAFILATVLPRNAAQGIIYLMIFCVGLVLALLGVSLAGRKALSKYRWASNPQGRFRRGLGVLFIVVGLAITTGYDTKFQVWAADHLPDIGHVDQHLLQTTTKRTPHKAANNQPPNKALNDKTLFNVAPYGAPELAGLTNWINSDPLTLQQLRGKVVLVDFWTYSCINCIRTLPHIESWYESYKDKGFVVIGVHAPEFSFEHVPSNVRDAVKKDGITYPVALDNNFSTWNAYGNQFWPAHYLIDQNGNVVNEHFGEGNYAESEKAIKALLGDSSNTMSSAPTQTAASSITPETYFGIARADRYSGTPDLAIGTSTFKAAKSLSVDHWTLNGTWDLGDDGATSMAGSQLQFHIHAKDVYVVAEPTGGAASVAVSIKGGASSEAATDVKSGSVTIDHSTIYHIASFDKVTDSTITLSAPSGVIFHTFTFG